MRNEDSELVNDQNKALAFADSRIRQLENELRDWKGLRSAMEKSRNSKLADIRKARSEDTPTSEDQVKLEDQV